MNSIVAYVNWLALLSVWLSVFGDWLWVAGAPLVGL